MGFKKEVTKIGSEILHVVEWPFKNAVELGEFIAVTMRDVPVVKEAVGKLILQARPVLADVTEDIALKGLSLQTDLQTIKDLVAFAAYFKNEFLPVMEKSFKDFEGVTVGPQSALGPHTVVPQ